MDFEKHYFAQIEQEQLGQQVEHIPPCWYERYEIVKLTQKILSGLSSKSNNEAIDFIASHAHELTPQVILELLRSRFNEGADFARNWDKKQSQKHNREAQGEPLLDLKCWFYCEVMKKGKVKFVNGQRTGGWKDLQEIYIEVGESIINTIGKPQGINTFIETRRLTDTTKLRKFLETHTSTESSTLTEKDGQLHKWLKAAAKDGTIIIYDWQNHDSSNKQHTKAEPTCETAWFSIQEYVQRKLTKSTG